MHNAVSVSKSIEKRRGQRMRAWNAKKRASGLACRSGRHLKGGRSMIDKLGRTSRPSRAMPSTGKHYGLLSAKFLAVLNALLWGFHNAQSGRCFPSYETIAEKADCARSTVYE